MKLIPLSLLMVSAAAAFAVAAAPTGKAPKDDQPRYDARGRLLLPGDFREWVFLSAGLDMNYTTPARAAEQHVFGNVFAPRAAYAAFKKTGSWPDKTILILENRLGASKGSINKAGQFQTAAVGTEAHVKDTARFKGGWGFFAFRDGRPAERIAYDATCYSCHRDQAAVDTTFVQFYPTLLPIATARGTLSQAYRREEAAPGSASSAGSN